MGAAAGSAIEGQCVADLKTPPSMIVSNHSNGDSKPDGNLKKAMWSAAKPVWFDQAAFSDARYREFKTKVASCWSAQFLYLAFWCPYETLTCIKGKARKRSVTACGSAMSSKHSLAPIRKRLLITMSLKLLPTISGWIRKLT